MKWTKEKPTSPGYYWAKHKEEKYVLQVLYISGQLHADNIEMGEFYTLKSKYFNNYLWGDESIKEPDGENT